MLTQAAGIKRNKAIDCKPAKPAATRLVFAGGKGGVGTTQVVVNLAAALTMNQKKALVIDAGSQSGGAAVALGIDAASDIQQIIKGDKSIEETICHGPCGIHILPAYGSDRQGLAPWQRERLTRGLLSASAGYDFVLIDAPESAAGQLARLLQADAAVIVTTTEKASLTGAYAVMKDFAPARNPHVQVVVNFAGSKTSALGAVQALTRVAQRALLPMPGYLGYVPKDETVAVASQRQMPILLKFPDQPAAQAIEMMASKIIRSAELRKDSSASSKNRLVETKDTIEAEQSRAGLQSL